MADDEAPTRRYCAASEVHRQLLSVDPDYREARQQIENETDADQARGFAAAARRTRTIPTVVHVVYRTERQNISNAQINSQIRILNEDFRKKNADRTKVPDVFEPLHSDCRIQFRLADQGRLRQRRLGHHAHAYERAVVQLRRRREVEPQPAAPTRGRRAATSTSGSATSARACSATRSSRAARGRPTAS